MWAAGFRKSVTAPVLAIPILATSPETYTPRYCYEAACLLGITVIPHDFLGFVQEIF